MKNLLAVVAIISIMLGMVAFQCSSTELTSAKLYIQQKNLDRAKEVLLKEVENNPKSDEGFYLLGFIYGEEENLEKMIEYYDKSLAISQKFKNEIDNSRSYHWANSFNKGVMSFNQAAQTAGTSIDKSESEYYWLYGGT